MNQQELIKKIKTFTWKKWLEREFSPLVTSFFAEGFTKKYLGQLGLPYITGTGSLFQNGFWYESQGIWDNSTKHLRKYLKTHTMIDITDVLDKFYKEKKIRIKQLIESKETPIEKFKEIYEIITMGTAFIWLTHGLEALYKERLEKEVPKYIKEEIDEFIGKASFPKKKNQHTLMEDAIRKGENYNKIAEEFGWIKVRFTFGEPFSEKEIKEMAKGLEPPKKQPDVEVPKELKQLFDEVRELVYFRTARTDVFYEHLFLSRPILKEVAEHYKIPFEEIKFYTAQSLIDGNLIKLKMQHTLAQFEYNYYIGNEPILEEEKIEQADEVKGRTAFQGKVQGIVKIIKSTDELDKVKEGDILVTQMTFPSFIVAMHKAAAFVTDEGGITCHAAIVAREMHKPCVVGTSKATKVFKDGDLVEVDANKGIVRKI